MKRSVDGMSLCASNIGGCARCCKASLPISGFPATSGRCKHSHIMCVASGFAHCTGEVNDGSRGLGLPSFSTGFRFRALGLVIQAWRDTLLWGDLREKPYAGKPPVRICEGEAEWPSYSTSPQDKSATEIPSPICLRQTRKDRCASVANRSKCAHGQKATIVDLSLLSAGLQSKSHSTAVLSLYPLRQAAALRPKLRGYQGPEDACSS